MLACSHSGAVSSGKNDANPPPDANTTPKVQQSGAPNGPPIAMTPGSLLKPGTVHQLQEALNAHGIEAPNNGVLDGATQASLIRFQKKEKIADTGLPDRETLRRLGLDPDAVYKSTSH